MDQKNNHINYEELYPTVDDRPDQANYGEIYPQTVSAEEGWNNGERSYPELVPVTEHKDPDSRYPMAVTTATLYNSPPPLPGTPIGSEKAPIQTPTSLLKQDSVEEAPLRARQKKILGLRRRTFWILCGIVLVIVVAAAVGGGVGGSKSSKKSSSSSGAGSNSSSPSTSSTSPFLTSATAIGSATATVGSVPTASAINIHAIAASVTVEENSNYTSIAYQNTSSWEILYRFSSNGTFSDAQKMSLPLTPIQESPLAMTSNVHDSGVTLNVFYISNLNQITNVNITCPTPSFNCLILNVTQISTPISDKTSLAAEYLGSTLGWRVFYQNENNMVSVISSIDDSGNDAIGSISWDNGTVIGGETMAGSAIASSLGETSGNLTVFYVGGSGIEMVGWDGEEGKWLEPTQFPATTAPNFSSGSSSLTAVSQSGTTIDGYLYYLGTNKQLYSYTSTANQWTTTPSQSTTWAVDDSTGGCIAAIGRADQVRIYYQSGGEVVESTGNEGGTVWEGTVGV